jgi:hypothetical protein
MILFDSYHQRPILCFILKSFTISWGEISQVSQREVNATLSAVQRSDGLKLRKGTCPGFWPLSPV